MKKTAELITKWIFDQISSAGCDGCLYGLSGGIDSAVVAVLCKRAYPKNCLAVLMPCHSNPQDLQDALSVVKKFEIDYLIADLGPVYDKFIETVFRRGSDTHFIAEANVKSRLRMTILYYYANLYNYLVVGTGNKSEIMTGYFTKHGDGGVDILPLGGLLKTEVVQLAEELTVPESIIEKKPSAGLWVGQTDEQEMGINYSELDRYLASGEASEKVKERVEFLKRKTMHKRRLPPIPDI